MSNNQTLPTTTGSGTQATTGTPQNVAPSSSFGSTEGNSSVQPTLSNSILESQSGGIPLTSTPLVAYDLSAAYPGTAAESTQAGHYQPNHALLGISVLLLVVAVVLFWSTSKKPKNTTE